VTLDPQVSNFIFYNGLGIAALLVFVAYTVFLFDKYKRKEFDFSFEFGFGIWLSTMSKLIERGYYGYLRAMQFTQHEAEQIISQEWIITVVALIGIAGFLFHIRTLTRVRFKNGFLKASIWIILSTMLGSLFWALYW
jgi:hypothetical protein